MSNFIFTDGNRPIAVNSGEVPPGITSKAVLMEVLFEALKFPDYFGSNWDALWECICDLSWLPEGDVILAHHDIPLTEDRTSLLTYLSILNDAVERWNKDGGRQFTVFFPSVAENMVRSILAEK